MKTIVSKNTNEDLY